MIVAALQKFNATRCSPPKPVAELYEIARFVGGKAPARPASSRAYDGPPGDASDPGDPWSPSPSSPPPEADSPPPGEPDGSDPDADPECDAPKLTELGNAQRFARMHGSRMRYVHKWRKWLLWDGRRWCRDEIASEDTAAKQVVHKLYGDAAQVSVRAAQIATIDGDPKAETKLATAITKHAAASSKASAIRAMVKLAQSEPPIAAPASAFDRDGWVLNVENGTIDLRTGLLRAHRQSDMITMIANVSYDPDAQCPRWDAFLECVLPDRDTRSWLQRFLGYCLTGNVSEHVLAFLYGSGANGKSVLFDTMINILGDYGMRAAPDLVLAKYGEAHPTEFADLEGRRLVLVSEIDQGRAWSEATIKRITGDTTIKARRMRRDFTEFPATHKLVIAANTKPVVRSTDDGIWRRMRLVPFGVTIPPEERDKGLIAKLLEERAGILAWAVRGCLAWQHEGLGNAGAVDNATAEYRKAQDILGNWIADECVVGSDEFTPMAKLYESYTGWCARAGYDKPWKRDTVRDRLLEREGLAERRTASARGIQGLGLHTGHSRLAVSR
jgi:putative DNA primase/helicase